MLGVGYRTDEIKINVVEMRMLIRCVTRKRMWFKSVTGNSKENKIEMARQGEPMRYSIRYWAR